MSQDRRMIRMTVNVSAPEHISDEEAYTLAEAALRAKGFGDVAIAERGADA